MTATPDQIHTEDSPTGGELFVGFEQYWQFVRQQLELQREFTLTWAAAMTSVSRAMLGQLQSAEHILAGQADQLAEHAHGAELVTRGVAQQVEIAERTWGNWVEHLPSTLPEPSQAEPSPSGPAQPPTEHKATPDIFDELLELVVDEDIKAAIP